MAITLKSLDQVLGLKRRRIDRLKAQAAEQARQVKVCETQVTEAQERQKQAEAVEEQVRATIETLCTSGTGFRPSDLITLGHVLDMKLAETKVIIKQVQAAEKQLEAAREAVRETRRQIDKSEQQLEQLNELRVKLAQEILLAEEDASDEEAEETSVGRMISNTLEERALEAAGWS